MARLNGTTFVYVGEQTSPTPEHRNPTMILEGEEYKVHKVEDEEQVRITGWFGDKFGCKSYKTDHLMSKDAIKKFLKHVSQNS